MGRLLTVVLFWGCIIYGACFLLQRLGRLTRPRSHARPRVIYEQDARVDDLFAEVEALREEVQALREQLRRHPALRDASALQRRLSAAADPYPGH